MLDAWLWDMGPGQGSVRMAVHHRRRGRCPPLDPSPQDQSEVGKKRIYHLENLVGPFLIHKLLRT